MRLHDWTRVEAGIYHDFHFSWIGAIKAQLNTGLLPSGYYASAEQIVRPVEADILTLATSPSISNGEKGRGGVAVAEVVPRVSRQLALQYRNTARPRQRSIAIRHVTGHRLVAVIEIASPSSKDRAKTVNAFVQKVVNLLRAEVHFLVADVFPPGRHNRNGLPGAVVTELMTESEVVEEPTPLDVPPEEPLTFASFAAGQPVKAYLEYRAVGAELPTMPLFLTADRYVNLPLGESYGRAWQVTPAYWQDFLGSPSL